MYYRSNFHSFWMTIIENSFSCFGSCVSESWHVSQILLYPHMWCSQNAENSRISESKDFHRKIHRWIFLFLSYFYSFMYFFLLFSYMNRPSYPKSYRLPLHPTAGCIMQSPRLLGGFSSLFLRLTYLQWQATDLNCLHKLTSWPAYKNIFFFFIFLSVVFQLCHPSRVFYSRDSIYFFSFMWESQGNTNW